VSVDGGQTDGKEIKNDSSGESHQNEKFYQPNKDNKPL
jgi:hypothetical protein